jgi:protein gp37
MADKSPIGWLEGGSTWNIFTGCSHASPGCDNCYAESLAATRLAHLPDYAGLTKVGRNATCPCGSGKKYKRCCMGKEQGR